MVEITIDYEGQLHCSAKHGPSGERLSTDAPVDNEGRGESFSPTDLVATALGTCMVTTMAIAARRKDLDVRGVRVRVVKEMTSAPPRRIERLGVRLEVPLAPDHPLRELLTAAAEGCPVILSVHPDVRVDIEWAWTG